MAHHSQEGTLGGIGCFSFLSGFPRLSKEPRILDRDGSLPG